MQMHGKNPNQEQETGNVRINQEFKRSIDLPLSTPNSDNKEHRNQNNFPENKEKNKS